MKMFALSLAFAAAAATQAGAVTMQPVLEDADVAKIVAAAKKGMEDRDVKGCIAISNAEGSLIYFEREQGAYTNCNSSALVKAHTASMFQTDTDTFMNMLNKDGVTNLLAVPDLAPMPGGSPIKVDGVVVGGVGVSTPDGNLDIPIAKAAAGALEETKAAN
ncbi:heme-binding protein [Thioclava sp. GXIMD2076]|uniref:Heme-binding protein n=1 Tax=Thioclava kandeliae TaxID=3070818 RepID=A0ABV1SHQ0_9RHOB